LIIDNDIFAKPANTSFKEKGFEKLYITSREKENRLYTDGQVEQLPLIEKSHIHYNEWQVRKRSATRLIHYLENKNRPLSILEIGCGNGWLSGRLAAIGNSTITGMDINKTELDQAKRVFIKKTNISFIEGDISGIDFKKKFDAIIFAASIQYFPSFNKIIKDALSLLNEAGEIHILDSHFYKANDIEHARQRTNSYYRSIGYEKMAEFYFHHSVDSLNGFNYKLLFNPSSLKNRLFSKKDPFPWICITVA
jgi:ubiquinone/menaquinone biosynthesis C-methylase UbiE